MCIHDTVGALPDIHVWQLLLIEKDAKIFYTPVKVATTQMQIVLYKYQSLQYEDIQDIRGWIRKDSENKQKKKWTNLRCNAMHQYLRTREGDEDRLS